MTLRLLSALRLEFNDVARPREADLEAMCDAWGRCPPISAAPRTRDGADRPADCGVCSRQMSRRQPR